MNLNQLFETLRNDKKHHLGLGDIRLTFAQQVQICNLAPHLIIQMYASWKELHPDEDYQYDQIKDFFSLLSRDELLDIMEFLFNTFKK